MDVSPTQFNPLPVFDSNAVLQRKSVHALYAITKPSDLVLRGEQLMDYGVDATFEVVVGGRATNYTSQIQLKAVQSAEFNRDGSVSKSIAVANLNYLLNGQCPIYLLYAVDLDRFWFVWAVDELKKLEAENPSWREQDSVTIRFAAEFNEAALSQIHSRIVQESKSRRQVVETIARFTLQGPIKFSVDPQTFKTDNAEDAYQALISEGFTLVSCGFWRDVLERFQLLPVSQKREPRICVIAAYAHYSEGRYLPALGYCGDAYLRAHELMVGDRDVLDTIRDACESLLGRITRGEYARRQMAAAAAPGASVQRRLEATRFQFLAERDEMRKAQLFEELKHLASTILADSSSSYGFKLQTRLHVAYAEGWQCHMGVTQCLGELNIQHSLAQSWAAPDAQPLREALAKMAEWDFRMRQLVRDTEAGGIPWLCAEARRTALLVRTAMFGFRRFQAKFLGIGTMPSQSEAKPLLADATEVEALFKAAGNIEGEMRAKIASAELYEIIDDISAAKKIAAEVKLVADALCLHEVRILADQHLNGTTLLRTTESSTQERREKGSDLEQATMSEADVDYYAEKCWSVSQLPESRKPVIRREVVAMKLIAIERLRWCRHIEQIQNLFHSRHPSTAYATDPERFCRCEKHKYESLQGATDARQVIDHFKKVYCEGCQDRDPKMPGKK